MATLSALRSWSTPPVRPSSFCIPALQVNADGSIDDVPGWILTDDGLWIRDPSDEFLREGIQLSYTVNPTATAFVEYPPESSACANPENPPPPRVPPTPPRGGRLPPTR